MLYAHMLKKLEQLEKQMNSIEKTLPKLPEGKIVCTRNQTRYKWYHSDGKKHVYIPKKNRHFAEQLALKKYLLLKLKYLTQEKRAIEFYLRHHPKDPGEAELMLTENPEYRKLLSNFFRPQSEELLIWMNSPYNSNPKYPEQLIHKTHSGHMVRSKSEVLIDMILFENKIPFRYESPLLLGDSIIYPDFTIRHPHTGDTYYWEHFGLMDDPSYSKKAISKLQLYVNHGIIPSIKLITTYETKEHPLGIDKIENIAKEYFL